MLHRDASIGVNLYGKDVTASKALENLGKNADKFGLKMKLTLAGVSAAFIKLGADSVSAAIEDQKSTAMLARTLKQSGWSSMTKEVEKFITTAQMASGISDNDLRNSMITLTNVTGNAAASQNLLQLAMDVSAGTGKDLATTTMALAKLLAGQRTGLMRLGTGLDLTTMKTGSFVDILGQLKAKFSGADAVAADTFSGKIDRLRQAIGEGKETVGYALIDSFAKLAGNGDINKATQNITNFSNATATAVTASANAAKWVLDAAYNATHLYEKIPKSAWRTMATRLTPGSAIWGSPFRATETERASSALKKQTEQWKARSQALSDQYGKQQLVVAATKAQAKADASATARAKKAAEAKAKQTAAANAHTAALAKELRMKQLSARFDLQLIGINAARQRAGNKDVNNRLDAMEIIAKNQAGLSVSDSAVANATRQMTVNNTVTVQGSVVTQQELTAIIAQELQLAQQRNGHGKWGGGL